VKLVHDNIVPVAWVVFVRFAIIENLGVHSICEAYEEASDTVGNITSLGWKSIEKEVSKQGVVTLDTH
jgi:hypothetical protein